MGGDDEFPLASLFTKRGVALLGVSNLFFPSPLRNPPFLAIAFVLVK